MALIANDGTADRSVKCDSSGRLEIISSGPVTGTVDTELPAAAALGDNEANATAVPSAGARLMFFDGTTWDRVRGNSTDGLTVSVIQTVAPTKTTTVTGTETEISVLSSNTSLLASNSLRKKAFIQNHGADFIRVSLSPTATLSSAIRLAPAIGTYTIEADGANSIYIDAISAISEGGTCLVGVIEEIL